VGVLNADSTHLFVAGGADADGPMTDAWRYDIDADRWEETDPLPIPLYRATAVQIDDVAYVYGGTTSGFLESDRLYAWDLSDGTWEEVHASSTNIPTGRYKHASAVWEWTPEGTAAGFVVSGGRNNDGETVTFDDLWHFDVAASAWTEVETNLAVGDRYRQGLAWYDGALYHHGGLTGDGVRLDMLWSLDPASGVWIDRVTSDEAPAKRASHTVIAMDNGLVMWGGNTEDADVWHFDPFENAWTVISDGEGPAHRDAHVAALTADQESLYVFGGDLFDEDIGNFVNDLWRFDLKAGTWTELQGF
jgi:N-acetylneuraminic acid mutarotase